MHKMRQRGGIVSDLLITLVAILGFVILAQGVTFLAEGTDFWLYKAFAPRREAVRREVFEETKSYNDGMAQEIQAMQFQYVQADPEHRSALRTIILHRVAGYDRSRFPLDLQRFLSDLESNRTEVK